MDGFLHGQDAARSDAGQGAEWRAEDRKATLGVILAGGAGRRLGGVDKALLPLGKQPLLAHVAERLAGQVGSLLLSANGDPARFAPFGMPVVEDGPLAGAGPLAGLLAACAWAKRAGGIRDLLTVPVDTPFFPADLAARLHAARQQAGTALAYAVRGEARHPTFALFALALAEPLRGLFATGERRLERAFSALGAARADFADLTPDPFLNLNTWADVKAAMARLEEREGEEKR
jgi:molybdopterin-guanine dinucleotide biosynthesis protein A